MGRFFFFIGEGMRALRRSPAPSAAAIVTVAITMLLLGVLTPVLQATSGKTEEVREQVGLSVYLFDDATQPEIDELMAQIQAIPHVASVEFVSKERALDDLSRRFDEQNKEDLTEQLPGSRNPLPASFQVKPDDLDNLAAVRSSLTPPGDDGKPAPISPIVDEVDESREEANTITKVTGALKWGLTIVAALLLVASLLLVANTIRLSIYARRREVEVMQLVGATNWFIRWPFVVEGIICGLIGGLVAIAILFLGKETVLDPLADTFDLVASERTIAFTKLTVLLLIAAMTVSAIGSGLTLRRFLRV
ncbi:MAG: permease-like cell division protein FtsX [Solirubrobacterales bacterium]